MLASVTADSISAASGMIVVLAAAFAAWQGIRNLSAWREQTVGTRKLELAENALIQFYEIEHALRVIRSPFSRINESAELVQDIGESQKQKHARNIARVTFKRLGDYHETISSFRMTSLKIRAIFGDEVYSQCAEVQHCWHEVSVAAHMLGITLYEGYDIEFKRSLEETIWQGNDSDTSIHVRVATAIECAERLLRPHLKS